MADETTARQGAVWMTVLTRAPWVAVPVPAGAGQTPDWRVTLASQRRQ